MPGAGRQEVLVNILIVWPFLILSIAVVLSDQIFKYIVFDNLGLGESLTLIKGVLFITPTYNTGIAFGLFKNNNMVFILISIIVSFVVAYIIFFKRPKSTFLKLGLFLILSGAISNLFDRLMHGAVLDFIDFRIWPVFNIADSAITIGACIIVVGTLLTKKSPACRQAGKS